uniref:hypothetical protein n=1 Tax=Infundibulicybe hongyinpan TaxID=2486348 RepID=UPI00315D1403
MDEVRNTNIKITRTAKGIDKYEIINKRSYHSNSSIKPIKSNIFYTGTCEPLATMDIETMDCNGNQIPVAISTSYLHGSNLFIIDPQLPKVTNIVFVFWSCSK